MKPSNTLMWLVTLVAGLALIATVVGLFYQDTGNSFSFTSVRGETAQIYGQGLYRYDSKLVGTGLRVQDAVTLVLGLPLLVFCLSLSRRGSMKGRLALTGALAYFLYNYASLALGAAFNNLFLLHVAIFSASLFGLVLALTSVDAKTLSACMAGVPRRGISVFLVVSGLILIAIWLFLSILPALLSGNAPVLEGYTTGVTWVIDIGFVGPSLIIAGVLLHRRSPFGYLLAPTLLVFTVVLGIQLAAMGIVQFAAGLFGIGQLIGMVVSFAILTLFAIWFTIALFRNFTEQAPSNSRKPVLARA